MHDLIPKDVIVTHQEDDLRLIQKIPSIINSLKLND